MKRFVLDLNEEEIKLLGYLLQVANNQLGANSKLDERQHAKRIDLINKVTGVPPLPEPT
jgi:hypothetical protein